MKLKSIILETIEDQINTILSRYNNKATYHYIDQLDALDSDAQVKWVINLCKAVSEKYWKWVLNQIYKQNIVPSSTDSAFRLGRIVKWINLDAPLPAGIPLHMTTLEYANILKQFRDTSRKGILQGKESDINTYNSISDIYLTLKQHDERAKQLALANKEVAASGGRFNIIRVNTPWDLEKIGSGTGWCTRGDAPECKSNVYIEDFGHIYVVLRDYEPYIQFTPDLSEVQDNNRNYAYPQLLEIIFGSDKIDNELVMDLMTAEHMFWSALRRSSSPIKRDILRQYEAALADNLKSSQDGIYLDRLKELFQYFGYNDENDLKRLREYEDITLRSEDADTPF
jgi:hypothetical protein